METERCLGCNRDLPKGLPCPKCTSVTSKALDNPDLKKHFDDFDLMK